LTFPGKGAMVASHSSFYFFKKTWIKKGGDLEMFKMRDRGWIDIDLQTFGELMEYDRFLRALNVCMRSFHQDELRKDGRPYETHPMRVAQILIYFGITDENSLIAALFHDSPEHIGLKLLDDMSSYGKEVVAILRLVTRIKGQDFGEYCQGILSNEKAVKVKLADRLHNLRNMVKRIGTDPWFSEPRLERQTKETEKHILPMAETAMVVFPQEAETIAKMAAELRKAVRMAKLILE